LQEQAAKLSMDTEKLEHVARSLTVAGKGLLAADESNASCEKRFDAVGVPCTEETRREYRELLVTTPGAEDILSGVIFFDETFWQSTGHGQVFREYLKNHDVQPGIKVDKGLVDLPGFPDEKLTQGLDGLPERMATYAAAGAKFAKWRAVITIGEGIPTDECIGANTFVLSRYARICQEYGIVPIVEPEVLFDGNHTAEQCEATMAHVFDILFQTMRAFRVHLPGAILKTSMALPGKDSGIPIDHDDVAERTVRALHDHVPHELGGVVFLSGGQKPTDAFINLNRIAKRGPHPWGLTFSYSRALQDPVLKHWAKHRDAINDIQELFLKQLQLASAASKGELDESQLENDSFVSHSQDL
jgi:fructose-bisphosphate aldolase class I